MAFNFADVIVCLYLMEVRGSDSRFIAYGSASPDGAICFAIYCLRERSVRGSDLGYW